MLNRNQRHAYQSAEPSRGRSVVSRGWLGVRRVGVVPPEIQTDQNYFAHSTRRFTLNPLSSIRFTRFESETEYVPYLE